VRNLRLQLSELIPDESGLRLGLRSKPLLRVRIAAHPYYPDLPRRRKIHSGTTHVQNGGEMNTLDEAFFKASPWIQVVGLQQGAPHQVQGTFNSASIKVEDRAIR